METSPEIVASVLWELRLIRWLLILLLLVGVAFVSFLFFAGKVITEVRRMARENRNRINQEIEDLLHKGLANEAFFTATELLAARPKDPTLQWYLGRAQYHQGKLHEAKRTFQAVLESSPEWRGTVQPWLDLVEERIDETKPRVVQ